MLLVFGSAKPLAEFFKRLQSPGIVGGTLASVLIGPNKNMSFLAEIGLCFYCFASGSK
jgi:Kef-type K+ transport system membrane component KefB